MGDDIHVHEPTTGEIATLPKKHKANMGANPTRPTDKLAQVGFLACWLGTVQSQHPTEPTESQLSLGIGLLAFFAQAKKPTLEPTKKPIKANKKPTKVGFYWLGQLGKANTKANTNKSQTNLSTPPFIGLLALCRSAPAARPCSPFFFGIPDFGPFSGRVSFWLSVFFG